PAVHADARGVGPRPGLQQRDQVQYIVDVRAAKLLAPFAAVVAAILAGDDHKAPTGHTTQQRRRRSSSERAELAVAPAIENHAGQTLAVLWCREVAIHLQAIAQISDAVKLN